MEASTKLLDKLQAAEHFKEGFKFRILDDADKVLNDFEKLRSSLIKTLVKDHEEIRRCLNTSKFYKEIYFGSASIDVFEKVPEQGCVMKIYPALQEVTAQAIYYMLDDKSKTKLLLAVKTGMSIYLQFADKRASIHALAHLKCVEACDSLLY